MMKRLRVFRILLLLVFFQAWASVAAADSQISPDLIRRVELHWDSVTGAQNYEFQLSMKPDFEKTLYSEQLKETKFSVDLLPGSYYYRIRAYDNDGRPGRWTAPQDLQINARPPILLSPSDGSWVTGALPDTGFPLHWRASGPGIRYLIEIKEADESGQFTHTVTKQEITDIVFPFFPQEPGKYQWSVHTLGPAGDEPGPPWIFTIVGTIPKNLRKKHLPPGIVPKRVVEYVPPWWRNHWTLFTRYGQSAYAFGIVDRDMGATSSFSGLSGYVDEDLYWEWHDNVSTIGDGIPWFELDWRLDRQTVLGESVLLPNYSLRLGAWYDEWLDKWRFSPVMDFSLDQLAIYQPRSPTEAARSDSSRFYVGVGPAVEYKLMPFLILGADFTVNFEEGGLAGLATINGDQLNLNQRAGNLLPSIGFKGEGKGTLMLGKTMLIQGRFVYQSFNESWVPLFPNRGGNSTFSILDESFDVSFGIKF